MNLGAIQKRYEALSLRERAFVMLALLGVLVASWDSLLMDPLRRKQAELQMQLAIASEFGGKPQSADASDPRQLSITRAGELQIQIKELDSQLASTTSGFVSSQRMIEVLHDVLNAQGSLDLVTIRNLPVTALIPDAEAGAPARPPYVHSIEIVIDGEYADILDYLGALEALPWKFRWSALDLTTLGYPRNRVRIELSTLSLDSTWLGV